MSRTPVAALAVSDARPAFDYMAGFSACSVLASMDMAGLLPELEAEGVGEQRFGALSNDEAALLRASLNYLRQRGLAEERDGVYRLSDHGKAVSKDMGYLVWLVGGYGGPLHRLGEMLGQGKRYGVDHVRDVHWLADGTAKLAAKDVVPDVMQVLADIEFEQVLDIGCGNGRFLLRVCEQFGVRGVGVDLSPDACADAVAAVAASGLSDRVEIFECDAGALDRMPSLPDTDLVVTFFLLHEILAGGRDALVGWLRDLSDRLPPGAYLLAGEVQPPADDGSGTEMFTPEFTFVHALMRQRLFRSDDWREALIDGGFDVRAITPNRQPGGIVLLAQNAR